MEIVINWTQGGLTALTAVEVRTEARKLAKQRCDASSWIGSAGREANEHYILTGEKPHINPEPVPATVEPAPIFTQQAEPAPIATVKAHSNGEASIVDAIAKALEGKIGGATVDKREVNEIIDRRFIPFRDAVHESNHKLRDDLLAEIAKRNAPREIIITTPEGERREVGTQHYKFELLLKCLSARIPVMLVGPAASGKTHATHAAADALGLTHYVKPVCVQTTESSLLGYMDATGTYRPTAFRKAYEDGGIYVMDEMDAGSPQVLLVTNGGLSNGHMGFADVATSGMVDKHEDFRFVGTANTFGTGADRQYVGRNQLDAATLNRFAVIEWGYDDALTASLIGASAASPHFQIDDGGTHHTAQKWHDYVLGLHASADKLKERVVIGPRASLNGMALMNAGIGRDHVEELLIWAGMSQGQRDKIKAGA